MKKKGFTLTEMIAAIVIIALILGLAIAAYQGIRRGILRRKYENLVTYLETKAANYSEETGELNVTVERLIETGYIEPDEANVLKDPRDNSSMNCFILDSKYENGNYHAKMEAESIGENADGRCNTYEISKEIQICIIEGSNCNTTFRDWYDDNVELGVLIGNNTELAKDADIVWKVNGTPFHQKTYTTNISTINKGTYTVDVKYIFTDSNGNSKSFEGSDTVAINIDRENPKITNAKVENAEIWQNKDKQVDFNFTDFSGSGVTKIIVYSVNNGNEPCPKSSTEWVSVTGNSYKIAKGTGKYKACVVDAAGNMSDPYPVYDPSDPDSGYIEVEGIDSEAPTCEITVSPEPDGENGWHITEPVKVEIICHDDVSGVKKCSLNTTNAVQYDKNSSYEITKDIKSQEYFGFVRDNGENTNTCNMNKPVKVDLTNPTVEDITKSTNAWSNQPIIIKSTIKDATSQLAGYAVTTSDEKPINWEKIKNTPESYDVVYNVTANGTYYIWAKDNSGRISKKSVEVKNYDNIKPTINTPEIKPTEWTNGDVTITIGVKDEQSKLGGYAITTSDKAPTTWENIKNSPASYNIIYKATANGTYYIWVKDTAGNISYTTVKISNIDKTKPSVTAQGIKPIEWTNGTVDISAVANDNESKLIGYTITKSDKVPDNWTAVSGSPKSQSISHTVTENGTYYIWAKDTAGNTSYSTIKVTNIDKVKPTLKTPTIDPTKWTNGGVKISAVTSDSDSKIAGYAVTTSDNSPANWTAVKNSPKDYTIVHTVTENGTYYVWVKDTAGNISYTNVKVANIDKTAPTIKNPTANPTAWTNGDVTIVTTLTDKDSKLVGYNVTNSATAPATWTSIKNLETYDVNRKVTENGTYYIWTKDAAGNVSSSSIEVKNIDKVKPTITAPKLNPNGWTNGNVTISFTVKDSESKLKSYAISTTNKTPTAWETIKNSPTSQDVTYNVTNNATYYIWVKDVADNIASTSIEVKNIDKVKPTINNLTTNPTTVTNGNVKITATLKDSNSKLLGYYVQTNTGTPTNWTSIKNSPESYSLEYNVSENGTYYVWVKDSAGNTDSKSIKVSNIDRVKPTVSVQYTSTKYDSCATSTQECYDKQNGCAYYNNAKCTYVGEVVKDTTYNDYYCNSMYSYDTYNPNLPTGYPSAQEITAAQGSYYSSSGIPKVSSGSNSYLDALLNNADAWYEAAHQNAGSYYNSPSIGNNCSIPNSVSVTCKCMETNYEKVCNTKCNPGYVTNWDKTGKFTITASDDVKLAYYAVTKSNSTPSNSEWKQITGDKKSYTTPYSVNTNGTYYVWVRDAATNTSYTTVKIVTADSTAPTISGFTIVDADNNEYNSNNMKMTISASDSDSGVYEYCVSKTNSSSGCSWSKDNPTIMTDGTNGSGSKLTYYAFVRDKVGNVSTSKSASYTLYKACTKKISRKEDSVGECTGECGSGKQSVTHYWKDAYLGTTCDNTTGTESCIVTEGCCQGCQCYGNCPPIPNIPTIPTCNWKCMADYNSAAWHNCTGTCSYYNAQGILTEGGTRSDLHNANEGLYGTNCTGCTYTENNGQWHYPNGDCANCKS